MKESFLLYNSFYEPIKYLSDEQLGRLFRAIFNYSSTGEITEDKEIMVAFMFIKNQLDFDNEKYQNICERNRINGQKGGRPKKDSLKTIYGEEIPTPNENEHFLYFIYDKANDEYKIGETKDLIQRRYDIKRPTNTLTILDYYLGEVYECQKCETDILKKYKKYSVGGDWFKFPNKIVEEILETWFSKKPIGFLKNPKVPKKPHYDNEYDNDINKREINKEKSFKKPTVEEIEIYCRERNNNIDPNEFYDFYESKGWFVGKNKMKDWKASIRTWENKRKNNLQENGREVKLVRSGENSFHIGG